MVFLFIFVRYLYPLPPNKEKDEEDEKKLIELRNNVCGGMALINILWVAINFMFQYKKPTEIKIPLSVSTYYVFQNPDKSLNIR